MRWNDIGEARCSVARALSVVGDRWTMLLVREAFLGTRRFDAFQRNTGASRAIVTERLRDLVAEGVLDRVQYHDHPERFEYRLTAKGRDLYPVVTALLAWGDRWAAGARRPARHARAQGMRRDDPSRAGLPGVRRAGIVTSHPRRGRPPDHLIGSRARRAAR